MEECHCDDVEERLKLITDVIAEVFWMIEIDADSGMEKFLYISPGYERIWRRPSADLYQNPRAYIEAIHPHDGNRIEAGLEARKKGIPYETEYRIIWPDGTIRWIWNRGFPADERSGRKARYVGVSQDITERRNALDAVRQSEERYRLLFDNMLEGFAYCRMLYDGKEPCDFIYLLVNSAFGRLTGLRDVVGKKVSEVIPGLRESNPELFDIYGRVARSGRPERFETYIEALGIWFSVSVYSPEKECFVAVFDNVTERKRAEAKVNFLANHDALTELPNRLLVRDRFEQASAYAERNHTKLAVLFLDLDQFKPINDTLGHHVGDTLLRAVAGRLSACVRDTDTVSRLGGDEFLIILSDVLDTEDILAVSTKILERMAASFTIDGHPLVISGSLGVVVYPDDGHDFETLLRKADMAMYHAKEAGRNSYRFFDPRMQIDAVERSTIISGLRQALEKGEFILHYQPQIDLASGAVIGAEALIRWNHPDLGLLPPGRFIAIAEESGLIVPIGAWVLGEVCRQAVAWQRTGLVNLVFAANISAVQFKRGNLETAVTAALAASGLDPACLELELTESVLIGDTDNVLATVNRLKAFGIKLSIDDFGTGYSSLSYLKRFAVDKLKIDQSFVRGLLSDPGDAAIVSAVIQMARSLGLRTIAEGVEDEETLQALYRHHCDEVQGYFLARPLPPSEFAAYCRRALEQDYACVC